MDIQQWLRTQGADIARQLEDMNSQFYLPEQTLGLAGKNKTIRSLQALKSALFPGVFDKYSCELEDTAAHIQASLHNAAVAFEGLICNALQCCCRDAQRQRTGDCDDCAQSAQQATIALLEQLPSIRRLLQTDIEAAFRGDPAAGSREEILLSYPGVEAVSTYRIAHALHTAQVPLIPRIMTEYAHQITGIDIHPGAQIGEYFFIDHGTGVVIGGTTTIGNNVKLYQGVTLGARSFKLDAQGNPVKGGKRHPDIEDNVIIYAGATILGGDTRIGHDSIIGGNVWLTHSVGAGEKIFYGNGGN